jgi:hypothetical protein
MWNVMVYQAGDNNLTEEMIWALKDMISAKVGKRVRLFVQTDPLGATPRRLDGTHLSGFDKLKELKEENIRDAVEKTQWYESLCESLKNIRQAITDLVPVGAPCPGNMSAALTHVGNALAIPDDFTATEQELDKLKKEITTEISGGGGGDIDLRELLRYVEQASSVLGEAGGLNDFKEFLKENSAAPEMIEEFFGSSINKVPDSESKNYYMLVLSGHGSGAVGDFMTDDRPLSSLSIPSLANILKRIVEKLETKEKGTVDILGMESCLMSMAEVCYELRENVRYMVGSEGLMLNTGWPYESILGHLKENLDMSPRMYAKQIVREYISYYEDYEIGGLSTHLSACDAEKMDGVAYAFSDLVSLLRRGVRKKGDSQKLDLQVYSLTCKILLAHWEAQSYQDEQYVDLWDFCERLKAHCRYSDDLTIIKQCIIVQKALEPVVLISGHTGAEFQHSTGLSIYFPWTADDFSPEYKDLKFSTDTKWGEFLEEFLESTRRTKYAENRFKGKRMQHYDVVDNPILLQLAAPYRNPKVGTKRNPKVGTKRNPKVGTKRYHWPVERSTMKNTPHGFYPSRLKKLNKDGECVWTK